MTFESCFYKKLVVYNITSSVLLQLPDEEELELFRVIREICIKYGEISPKLLENSFGLKSSISEKLLRTMALKYNILEGLEREDTVFYKLRSDFSPNVKKLKDNIFKVSSFARFTICLNPLLILTKKKPFLTIPDDLDNSVDIVKKLRKINEIINFPQPQKDISVFGIPEEYIEIELNEGIHLNGIAECKLVQNRRNFKLLRGDYLLGKITKNHPEYNDLISELNQIKSLKRESVNSIVRKKIEELFDEKNFSMDLPENYENITIILNDSNIKKIGRFYRLFNEQNGRTLDFELENDWFISLRLKINYANSTLDFWIKVLKEIDEWFREHRTSLINIEKHKFLTKIEEFIKDFASSTNNLNINYSEENICKIFQNVCNDNENDVFHIINAKLKEYEVFR
ncbi:MAG: hypothetical protein GF364_13305 [Candidatus Lokiarchaeota archaeon]|nr:hypothetical protein [Candidatus Lokiarchaeota archaeon]